MIISEILVPLLNANEPEARVVKVHEKEGQMVEKGAVLFTIETTKAASEIESPDKGVLRLLVKEGDTLVVGDKLAVLTETADESLVNQFIDESKNASATENSRSKSIPSSGTLRITKPAKKLAESLGVDLLKLPPDQLVTEEFIRQYVVVQEQSDFEFPASSKEYLLIFGGGGHAKTVMDMVKQMGVYSIAGIVDDNILLQGNHVLDIPVLGTRAILPKLKEQGIKLAANCVGGILDISIRVRIFEMLEKSGFEFPALVHPRATIEPSARIGEGVQVFANAYIGSDAVLQPKCMINTNAVVSHDCFIGQYSHIAPGVLLAGHVHVGEMSLVGMGVTTAIGVRIGSGVRIGNGAILLADVPDKAIIQAGRYWVGKAV